MKLIISGKDSIKKEVLYDLLMDSLNAENKIKHEGYRKLNNPKIVLNPHLPSFITVNFNTDKDTRLLVKEIYECIPVTTKTMDRMFKKYDSFYLKK